MHRSASCAFSPAAKTKKTAQYRPSKVGPSLLSFICAIIFFFLSLSSSMYSRVVLALLCAFVATTLAVQCDEVTSPSKCRRTIDDEGADCTWCARLSDTCSCIRSELGCTSVDCDDDGSSGGGGSSSDISGGGIAGIVIAVLVSCCCCLCMVAMAVGIIAGVVIFVRRGGPPTVPSVE